jgi:rhamnulokinase
MRHLAIDIGAESGRGIVGWIEDGQIRTIEVHRFENRPISEKGALYWDIDHLVYECFSCLEMAGPRVVTVGIDTWAVDHVLVDEYGQRVTRPRHYRDPRTEGVMARAFERVPQREIYELTGIQMLPFNSLYQLLATEQAVLDRTACFLTIPDYLHLKLMNGGKAGCEFTNATTTQLFDPRKGDWSDELISAFGLPRAIFPEIVQPGTRLGVVEGSDVAVIVPATHDTGSAVAGAPLTTGSAWISSGTWSILGIEVGSPVISDSSYSANFTNEGGVDSTYRLSKNVAGMWIVQQCRAAWGNVDSYESLMAMAMDATDTGERIDPDDPKFFAPGDMPARVSGSSDKGHVIRVVLSSLAEKYAAVLATAEELVGSPVQRIQVVGGGSKNRLLNQLTADACGKPVVAGPVEATALGNLAVQMQASGELASISEAREMIAGSVELETFEPCR